MINCLMYVLAAVVGVALAGYEHVCTYRDYQTIGYGRDQGVCGPRLTDFVTMLCGGSMNIPNNYKKRDVSYYQPWNRKYQMMQIPRGVGIDAKEANSLLSVSKKSGERGIVCECCIHRCKRSEMVQYCSSDKRRRRRRNVRSDITQADVDRFYEELESETAQTDNSEVDEFWYEEFEQQPIVKLLESYKQRNIAIEQSEERPDDYENNMADQKAEQNKMSDYLRGSLIRLLAKSGSAAPVKSSPHLTAEENRDLHSLWELFEHEYE